MGDTIIIADAGEGVEAPEIETPVSTEAAEALAEAAVEIAEIEKDRDIELAEISAESRRESDEAFHEALVEAAPGHEELEECRTKISTLEAQVMEQQELITSIQAQLTAQAHPNPTLPESEVAPVEPESQPEEKAPEPPKRVPKTQWI